MTYNLKDFERIYRFRPSLTLDEGRHIFRHEFLIRKIQDDKTYSMTKEITDLIIPEKPTEHDLIWKGLYMPFRRNGKIVLIPFVIHSYKEIFYLSPHNSNSMEIKPGNSAGDDYLRIILSDVKDLMEILRKEGIGIVNRCVPYDIRRGKVLGKHIFEKIVSKEEMKKIWISYKDRKTSVSFPDGSSLNDYLKVASICYNAAFGEKTKGMDPLQKYKRWADGRHGGMLDIKDPDSKEMFGKWLHSGRMGGHPFEIVFSWFQHGIHLYPPGENLEGFDLRFTNRSHMETALEMVRGLIREGIHFQFDQMEETLEYLAGETYIEVNAGSIFGFHYTPSREMNEKYFKVIEWEPLDIPVFI